MTANRFNEKAETFGQVRLKVMDYDYSIAVRGVCCSVVCVARHDGCPVVSPRVKARGGGGVFFFLQNR